MSLKTPDGRELSSASVPGRNNFVSSRPAFELKTPGTEGVPGNPPVQDAQYWWDGSSQQPLSNVEIAWANLPQKQKNWWIGKSKLRYASFSEAQQITWAPGLFADSVAMSAQYLLSNQQVTPEQAVNKYLGDLKNKLKQIQASGSPGGGGGFGSATPTVSGQNMHRLADASMTTIAGREATNAEAKAFTKDVRQSMSSNPTNTDPTFMADEMAKNTSDATEYAANKYMRVFLQSLGGIGG